MTRFIGAEELRRWNRAKMKSRGKFLYGRNEGQWLLLTLAEVLLTKLGRLFHRHYFRWNELVETSEALFTIPCPFFSFQPSSIYTISSPVIQTERRNIETQTEFFRYIKMDTLPLICCHTHTQTYGIKAIENWGFVKRKKKINKNKRKTKKDEKNGGRWRASQIIIFLSFENEPIGLLCVCV